MSKIAKKFLVAVSIIVVAGATITSWPKTTSVIDDSVMSQFAKIRQAVEPQFYCLRENGRLLYIQNFILPSVEVAAEPMTLQMVDDCGSIETAVCDPKRLGCYEKYKPSPRQLSAMTLTWTGSAIDSFDLFSYSNYSDSWHCGPEYWITPTRPCDKEGWVDCDYETDRKAGIGNALICKDGEMRFLESCGSYDSPTACQYGTGCRKSQP